MSIFRRCTVIAPIFALVVLLVSAAPMPAQEPDAEGSKDHPMIPRIKGYYINDYVFHEFEKNEFDLGNDKMQVIEGKFWTISYVKNEGVRRSSPLEIFRNYKNAFQQKGGKSIRYEEVEIAIFQVKTDTGELWCELRVGNDGDAYSFKIVEKAGMEQQVELNAADLAKALDAKGSVSLHGILFDTGKATIKPESAKVLATVGDLLKGNANLKLEIQGHTDNVGQKAANQTLSEQRANSVRKYLIDNFGIEAGRLTAAGFGDTKPVAPNTTDEGRAKNRRVELVKK
jgi:OmpA-OmpF porin, OOP family